jgi:regulatory protein
MKPITPEEALARLQNLCSTSEKCSYDVRQKLIEYKIEPAKIAEIIQKLQKFGFIDDERFACAFVRTKHKISKWGKQKIEFQLKIKHIPDAIIAKALDEINDDLYIETITSELQKKLKTAKAKSQQELTAKLMNFALSRGYDYNLAYEIIKKLSVKREESGDD